MNRRSPIVKACFTNALPGGLWVDRDNGEREYITYSGLVKEVGEERTEEIKRAALTMPGLFHTIPDAPRTFREFPSLQAARDYRHNVGTGGWIWQRRGEQRAFLFPLDMTPTAIVMHPLAAGSGELHGSM